MKAFCTGLPGWIWYRAIPCRSHQSTRIWAVSSGPLLFSVNYSCRFGSTISCRFRSSWIEINNSDACGTYGRRLRRPTRGGKRAVSTKQLGTAARARFPRRWCDPQAARLPDHPAVQVVDRRRARGSSGPGARPRGAGASGGRDTRGRPVCDSTRGRQGATGHSTSRAPTGDWPRPPAGGPRSLARPARWRPPAGHTAPPVPVPTTRQARRTESRCSVVNTSMA